LWQGDVNEADAILAEARRVKGLQDDSGIVAYTSFQVDVIRRDIQNALRKLELNAHVAFSTHWYFKPVELLRAQVRVLAGQSDLARRSFEAARERLEKLMNEEPEDDRYPSALALASAGLGLQAEALANARRGVELMPTSKDAWKAMHRLEELALVQTVVGQPAEALDQLDDLLSRTGEISTHLLRLDPRWWQLRSHPRFSVLLDKYGDKP
jgi:hypothetical protein